MFVNSAFGVKHLGDQAEVRSGNAANKDRKNLRVAWEWGKKFLGLPYENPFHLVERFSERRYEHYVSSLEEFWAVYDVADMEQDKVMLLTYLYTAARCEELFRLQWKHVDFKNNRILLRCKKNKQGEWWEG